MMAGLVSVPFYSNLSAEQLQDIIEKSDIKFLFIGKLEEWDNKKQGVPKALPMIHFPHYANSPKIQEGQDWDDLIQRHQPLKESPIPDLNDLWTIVFTSGTTGSPKGVMLSHAVLAKIAKAEELTNVLGTFKLEKVSCFSYLPLNHVAERVGLELPCLYLGGTMSFGESPATFFKDLQDTQPTMFFAVPRIWTKMYQRVLSQTPQKVITASLEDSKDADIFKRKIRQELGLENAKIISTGAAITPEYLKKWYKKLDIHLIESYGMTEVSGAIANGPEIDAPTDSVGKAVPFSQVKIDPQTQEVLLKSPFVMSGYYKNPEKTNEILRDGWIHSGDKGKIDNKGYLKIVGRVKDTFKTSKGKYIVPNPIEEKLASHDFIEQVCVVGIGIPQPIALVNLSETGLKRTREVIEDELEVFINEINKDLINYQKLRVLVITKTLWSNQNKLLTPTLKIRRGALDEKYHNHYLNWYEAKTSIIWE